MADSDSPSKRKAQLYKSRGPSISLPKLKKIKRDLLTDLALKSHECQSEILPLVQKSFHWRTSVQSHEFQRVQSVHNPELTAKYLEKRRDMKSCGYSDSLLLDTYAFIPVDNPSMVERICRDGVKCGNQKFSGLGVSHMAVHLCKHADILAPSKPTIGEKICLVVKVLKGKVKSVVCRNVGVQLEPTPNYDCHIAKPTTDPSVSLPSHLLFYSLQLYVYEYGDLGVEDYPKQILPYAVVHYATKEHQSLPPHIPSHPPYMQAPALRSASNGSKDTVNGPNNEIWRGRLHIRLIGGGHIYIDVSILSHFVPLTITLMSPLRVCHTYPNTNAQLTFLAGLTDIANKPEVSWRDYYFQSFVMKASANSENHFKALARHVSNKQEMAAARLPKDVYLFLMPKCLLASQLGLVQGTESDPILYCLLMSKVSTIKNHKNKVKSLVGEKVIRKCGKARRWEELFEDSDEDEEMDTNASNEPMLNPAALGAMFEQQRQIQNRLAAMRTADVTANFHPCGCGKPPAWAAEMSSRRSADVQRVVVSIHAQLTSQHHHQHSAKPSFPPGSRSRPKQRVSNHARSMPSFSPHGSSDSDSDSEEEGRGRKKSRHRRKHLSILDSNKTVEEELSEEELTNEQMEAIIFMRKPATTTASVAVKTTMSAAATTTSKLPMTPQSPIISTTLQSPTVSMTPLSPIVSKEPTMGGKQADSNIASKSSESPELRTEPKIIPIEPLDSFALGIASPTREEVSFSAPIIIPTEPVPASPSKPGTPLDPRLQKKVENLKAKPKSILKKACIPDTSVNNPVTSTTNVTDSLANIPLPVTSTDMPATSTNIPATSINIPATSKRIPVTSTNISVTSKNVPVILGTSTSVPAASTDTPVAPSVSSSGLDSFPSAIIKATTTTITSSTAATEDKKVISDMPHQNDMGDIDMRILPSHSTISLPAPFSSAVSPSANTKDLRRSSETPKLSTLSDVKDTVESSLKAAFSLKESDNSLPPVPAIPNWSQGSWLAPGQIPPLVNKDNNTNHHHPPIPADPFLLPHSPSLSQLNTPASPHTSLPSNSPPSPCPLSPGFESPPLHSPPSPASSPPTADIESPASPLPVVESPASPPPSSAVIEFRTTPIAIPTVRVKNTESPPEDQRRPTRRFSKSSHSHVLKSPLKGEAENADDMMEFLNSAATNFDSDDSPFEDDR